MHCFSWLSRKQNENNWFTPKDDEREMRRHGYGSKAHLIAKLYVLQTFDNALKSRIGWMLRTNRTSAKESQIESIRKGHGFLDIGYSKEWKNSLFEILEHDIESDF